MPNMPELGKWLDDEGAFQADAISLGLARRYEDGEEPNGPPTEMAIRMTVQPDPNRPELVIIGQLSLEQAENFRDSAIKCVQSIRAGAVPERL